MDERTARICPNPGTLASLAAILALAPAAPGSATAQDMAGGEGAITYSRDVHHSVGAPYYPGQTHSVVTGPTDTITGTIGIGLRPMSDEETASVTASLAPPVGPATQEALTIGLDKALDGSGGGNLPAAGEAGSIVGSTIGGALSVLPAAIGALTNALGGRQ